MTQRKKNAGREGKKNCISPKKNPYLCFFLSSFCFLSYSPSTLGQRKKNIMEKKVTNFFAHISKPNILQTIRKQVEENTQEVERKYRGVNNQTTRRGNSQLVLDGIIREYMDETHTQTGLRSSRHFSSCSPTSISSSASWRSTSARSARRSRPSFQTATWKKRPTKDSICLVRAQSFDAKTIRLRFTKRTPSSDNSATRKYWLRSTNSLSRRIGRRLRFAWGWLLDLAWWKSERRVNTNVRTTVHTTSESWGSGEGSRGRREKDCQTDRWRRFVR